MTSADYPAEFAQARERVETSFAEWRAAVAARNELLLAHVPDDADMIPVSLPNELGMDTMEALSLVRRARKKAGNEVPMLGIQQGR